MKIRNKNTGQIHEVIEGTLFSENIFELVTDDDIKVGEPTIEYEIKEEEPKKAKKPAKKTKKGAKKDDKSE